jgi:L-asparaginase
MRQDVLRTVIIGTGGTIAGTSANALDNLGYTAATLGVDQLVGAVPALRDLPLEAEQVAQLDSKDMDGATWLALARRAAVHLQRPEVSGLVITHGTDTLEETAWFLQRTLEPAKPVVLTAAMRPATSLQADGPQNLLDAVTVARTAAGHGRTGVVAVLGGCIWPAAGLRKMHPYRLDAFEGGDPGSLGSVQEGQVRWWREPGILAPLSSVARARALAGDASGWPRVAIVVSHAGADGRDVEALIGAGVEGLVVAGTGHATVHWRLEPALERARAAGVRVWRCSRCVAGDVGPGDDPMLSLTPWQARVELLLQLVTRGAPGTWQESA